MTKDKQPKVFISYAWNDQKYNDRVKLFADVLRSKYGIDSILDQYDLNLGHDSTVFMESIHEESITNVLVLLDPSYEEKANKRQGGVGIETQNMAKDVYGQTKQDRIIPIIFQKHPNGKKPLPHFLESRVYIDLSELNNFEDETDAELRKLINTLWHNEESKKPPLAGKPEWIDRQTALQETTNITRYAKIEKLDSITEKLNRFKEECNNFKEALIGYSSTNNDCMSVYNGLQSLKKDFLSFIKLIVHIPESINEIANLFESILNEYNGSNYVTPKIKLSLLNELFLYTVAFCLKNEAYEQIRYLLNHSYYSKNSINFVKFNIFYNSNEVLDNAVKLKDGRKSPFGVAQYWMDTLNTEFCSKKELIYADVFCFNVSLFQENNYWFPRTYVFDIDNSLMRKFLRGLKSKERLTKVVAVFGCNTTSDFIDLFNKLSKDEKVRELVRSARYPWASDSPDSIFNTEIVRCEELGTIN